MSRAFILFAMLLGASMAANSTLGAEVRCVQLVFLCTITHFVRFGRARGVPERPRKILVCDPLLGVLSEPPQPLLGGVFVEREAL